MAYRWGNREKHSYLVGVYSSLDKAINASNNQASFRGGKYAMVVEEVQLDLYKEICESNEIYKTKSRIE